MLCIHYSSSLREQLESVLEQEIAVRKQRYSDWCPGVLSSVIRIALTAQEVRLFNSEVFMKMLNLLQGHIANGFLLLGGAALMYEERLLAF